MNNINALVKLEKYSQMALSSGLSTTKIDSYIKYLKSRDPYVISIDTLYLIDILLDSTIELLDSVEEEHGRGLRRDH